MTEAIALYRSLGFVAIPAYNDSPDEVIHFEKRYAGRTGAREMAADRTGACNTGRGR